MKTFWNNNNAVAFDVSTWSTGWAAWIDGKLKYGCIQAAKGMLHYERVQYLARVVRDLDFIGDPFKPLFVFIEEGLFLHSAKNSMQLGEARGAVIAAIPDASAIIEVSVSAWKGFCGAKFKTVKGVSNRKKEKIAVEKFVKKDWYHDFPQTYSPIKPKEATYDITDAVGILTYVINEKEFE